MSQTFISSYSAKVSMWLDCEEFGIVQLARISGNTIEAREPTDIPSCVANLIVTVDESRIEHRINLFRGFSKTERFTEFRAVDEVAPF